MSGRYAGYIGSIVARDGLVCSLCGEAHSSNRSMRVDFVVPLHLGGDDSVDNAILVCGNCVARRHQRPLGQYWRERLHKAAQEIAFIQNMAANKATLEALRSSITILQDGPKPAPVSKPATPVYSEDEDWLKHFEE